MTRPALPDGADYLGDVALWDIPKTAFLCSRQCPAAAIIKIYEWAQQARADKVCVMSGFHTILEKDVWKILIKGEQPIIIICPRGLIKRPAAEQRQAIDNGRLLIVSPFANSKIRATKKLAHERNIFILQNAQKIIIGHATPNGRLAATLKQTPAPTRSLS